ncbi:MAG: diaminopimelate decarboxylase [Myxococcota bacterium]
MPYPAPAIRAAVTQYPTPLFLYDERRLRDNCRRIRRAFEPLFPGFDPLYAVKANANPHLLRIIHSEGFGLDCCSPSEIWLAGQLGARGVFTGCANPLPELEAAARAGLWLNLDDEERIDAVVDRLHPSRISLRINPGHELDVDHEGYAMCGADSKFGIPWERAVPAYRALRDRGVERFGIHMMTRTNVLEEDYFAAITRRLFEVMGQVKRALGIDFEWINIGGGFGVPYRPHERPLDLSRTASLLREVFDKQCAQHGLREPRLMVEPGRYLTADTGYLVGRVHVVKQSYRRFVGIDAGMNDLPRVGLYRAYHHLSVLDKDPTGPLERVSVMGRLCENTDQFARDMDLPAIREGDVVIIHHAGGHGYVQGYNYNGRPRCAEYLWTQDDTLRPIRRAETVEDLFRTVCP